MEIIQKMSEFLSFILLLLSLYAYGLNLTVSGQVEYSQGRAQEP